MSSMLLSPNAYLQSEITSKAFSRTSRKKKRKEKSEIINKALSSTLGEKEENNKKKPDLPPVDPGTLHSLAQNHTVPVCQSNNLPKDYAKETYINGLAW